MAEPYPKARQLARGERRYRRKIASPKQWAAIRAEKGGACRLWPHACSVAPLWAIELHHLVPRSLGGDDTAANIVPLCRACHSAVTDGNSTRRRQLAGVLTDDEYAYVISRLGEDGPRRLFGV